jgi:hypothetical protein
LIEETSGRSGIDPIEDFTDWYSQEYPNEAGFLAEPPKGGESPSTLARTDPPVLVRIDPAAICCSESAWRLARANDLQFCGQLPSTSG